MSTPRHAGSTVTYPAAELERRFYALAIDRLLAWATFGAAGYLAWRYLIDDGRAVVGVVAIIGVVLLVSLAYAVALGIAGVSPGKALVGLRVVAADDGRPIGVPQALVRTAILGFFTLPTAGLGLATLAWTAVMDPSGRRRGGHDQMTSSVVVDIRPAPAENDRVDVRPRQIVNLTAMRLLPTPRTPARSTPSAPETPTSAPTSSPTSGPPSAPMPSGPPVPATAAVPTPAGPRPSGPPPAAPPAASSAPASGPSSRPGRWRVAFDTGEEFVVEGLALVGRRPEPRGDEPVRHVVPLRSSDMSVSKTHAQFQVVPDGALVVMDRGSTNGSALVRQGVSRPLTAGRPATLIDGDTVRFGDRSMSVTQERS